MVEAPVSMAARLRTYRRLGFMNGLRVLTYRVSRSAGLYRLRLPLKPALAGPFFEWPMTPGTPAAPPAADAGAWTADAERVMRGELPVFSSRWVNCGFPPDWNRSAVTGVAIENPRRHWSLIPEFTLAGGDIKGYWEIARFDGLLILALGWICSRRRSFEIAIEEWLTSWCAGNPANEGVHWKCGQETGLRLLQLLLVMELLCKWGAVQHRRAMVALVAEHCARITPTLLYAVGQDNNHAVSEAAALFAGGAFVMRHGSVAEARRGRTWCRSGRRWLENRLRRLVMSDGSFAQNSVNYHRLMLDTCALVETLRRRSGLAAFSAECYRRCCLATGWLAGFIERQSGDAPNLGANDGARMFVLHRRAFRDFRPTVQWASALFERRRAYAPACCDEILQWLDLEVDLPAEPVHATQSQLWPDGGYARLQGRNAWALLRLPRYRFRPSQCDGLHLDLWVGAENALRDGGSYSYNDSERWLEYFGGTQSHNTVQFDDHEQMPRRSRFLLDEWLECSALEFDRERSSVMGGYRDRWGCQHRRQVSMLPAGGCKVVDWVSGFRDRAILRWRAAPTGDANPRMADAWKLGALQIKVHATANIVRQELVTGWESRCYGELSELPVLEVEVRSAATITTEISW